MAIESPLTDEDKAEIKAKLALVKELKQHIRTAEKADIPMGKQKALLAEQEQQLIKLQQAYFSGR